MDNFPQPQNPVPPSQFGQAPLYLPPRNKTKAESELSQNKSGTDNLTDEEAEAQLQAMLDEEVPPVPDEAPRCDWHLNAIMSGNYPDPFTLPALRWAQHSLIHSMNAFMEAIAETRRKLETSSSKNSNKDSTTK